MSRPAPLRLPSALLLAALGAASSSPTIRAQPAQALHARLDAPEAPPRATPDPLASALAAWITEQSARTVRVGAPGEAGSGVVVSDDGLVLTAAHVVGEHTRIEVTWPDGTHVGARVVAVDATRDLATIETGRAGTACAPLTPEPVADGSWLLVTGFPGGRSGDSEPLASLGLVLGRSTLPPVGDDTAPGPSLVTSTHTAPGMSGGPAIDDEGRLFGVAATLRGGLAPVHGAPLLQGVSCTRAPVTVPALPPVARERTHAEPDREASLATLFPPRVLPRRRPYDRDRTVSPSEHPSVVRLHGWGHDVLGIVVARELVLTLADAELGTVAEPRDSLRVVSHEDVRVLGPIAIRGELALVRTEGLEAPPLSRRAPAPLALGAFVIGSEGGSPGIVSVTEARPGELRPYIPPMPEGGCGTLYGMRIAAAPVVEIGLALAHDASAERGELLLDRGGRPLAIHVGHHVSGLGYAVPLTVARARFADLLDGAT